MDRWKSRGGKSQRREEQKREDQRRESLRRKKIQVPEKVGKLRLTVFFQWFVTPEGRKVGSLKRRLRSHVARWEMKNCTRLWREAHFQVKMYKAHHARTTFGTWDVEKVQAVVARSTRGSQNVQNTTCSDHFWKLQCRKSARRCGAKHISKSKCTKNTILGPLLEVEMSKKCTPLWREAHFEVNMLKTPGGSNFQPLLDVQMSFRVAGARDCGPCQKWAICEGFAAFSTTSNTTLHYNYTKVTFHYTTLRYTTLHCTPLHYTPLHSTTLHSVPLHYTTLRYTNYITLNYTTLHSIQLQLQLRLQLQLQLYYTTLRYTTLINYTTLHFTTLH